MTLTRRDFVLASAGGLVTATMPRTLAALARATGELAELRRGVGTFTARGGTIGWLVNRGGAVVVDSQYPDTAQRLLAGLSERRRPPFEVLINTHHHGDHTAGNGTLRDSVRHIVAHARVPDLQRRAAEAGGAAGAQVVADMTFDDQWSVDVGDEIVRARHYGPAHTGGDCVVVFERAGVVHLGDLVFNRAYPFIDRAGGASVRGWIGLLEAVTAEHPTDAIYVFGHTNSAFEVTGDRDDVLLQRDFLSAVLELAQRAVAAGRSRAEATALERLPAFPDHAPLADWLTLSNAVGAAYDEVAEPR